MPNRAPIQPSSGDKNIGDGRSRPFSNLTAKGFNLLELLLVVVIIGVLASIALPNYTKSKEHALGKEAVANLKVIAAAERIAKLETGSFQACVCSSAAECNGAGGCNSVLSMDLSANNWSNTVTLDAGSGGFYADAARQGSGGYYDCVYRLQANSTTGEPFVQSASGTCP